MLFISAVFSLIANSFYCVLCTVLNDGFYHVFGFETTILSWLVSTCHEWALRISRYKVQGNPLETELSGPQFNVYL